MANKKPPRPSGLSHGVVNAERIIQTEYVKDLKNLLRKLIFSEDFF